MRYAPAFVSGRLKDGLSAERQHISPHTVELKNQACQYTGCWPSASVRLLKFKVTVCPAGMECVDSEKIPVGCPWFGPGSISTLDEAIALPPLPSAADAVYFA